MSGKNYSHQLDAKNRMRIPAKLREELGDGYTITVGTGGCLYVYTAEQMKSVKETLKKINPFKEKQLQVARYILYNSWEAEEDKQGRILLPSVLREFAGLEKDVVLVGVASRIEIWSKDRWLQSISTYDDDMDEVAANMESLGFSI